MTRRVSPLFAAIVIVVVAVLGALYFFARLRAYDAAWLAEAEQLRAQARMQQTRRGQMRRPGRMRAVQPGGGREGAGGRVPGRQGPGPAAGKPGSQAKPTAKPK